MFVLPPVHEHARTALPSAEMRCTRIQGAILSDWKIPHGSWREGSAHRGAGEQEVIEARLSQHKG
jgi:hypothetical protein